MRTWLRTVLGLLGYMSIWLIIILLIMGGQWCLE